MACKLVISVPLVSPYTSPVLYFVKYVLLLVEEPVSVYGFGFWKLRAKLETFIPEVRGF